MSVLNHSKYCWKCCIFAPLEQFTLHFYMYIF